MNTEESKQKTRTCPDCRGLKVRKIKDPYPFTCTSVPCITCSCTGEIPVKDEEFNQDGSLWLP